MTTIVKTKVKAKNGPMVRIPKEKEEEMHRLYETYCSQGLSYNDAYNRAESEILNGSTK